MNARGHALRRLSTPSLRNPLFAILGVALVITILTPFLLLDVHPLRNSGGGWSPSLGSFEYSDENGPWSQVAVLNPANRVLVVYAFSHTDPEHEDNLHFFAWEGCRDSADADFVFVIQNDRNTLPLRRPLPVLPPNAKTLFVSRACNDWGLFGVAIQRTDVIDKRNYRFFIFVNSSVRGPFLPTYARKPGEWMEVLLSKLNERVKLVGSTISCENALMHRDSPLPSRNNPHIQSYAVATDSEGLAVLEADGKVFQCHADRMDAVYYSELGSSAAILNAGFGLDCLLLRYQGVDWRNTSNWNCNARLNPSSDHHFDDTSVHPFEVLFTVVEQSLLQDWMHYSKTAVKFAQWREEQERYGQVANVSSNDFRTWRRLYTTFKRMLVGMWGIKCFDVAYYKKMNPDLVSEFKEDMQFRVHYVTTGMMEARPFRYNCTGMPGEYDMYAGLSDVLADIAVMNTSRRTQLRQQLRGLGKHSHIRPGHDQEP